MINNYDQSLEINHNLSWSFIPGHSYKILITGSTGLGKTNALLNLIKQKRPDTNKICLYVKDPF